MANARPVDAISILPPRRSRSLYALSVDTGSDERTSTSTAFLLWLACALGLCGIHRFYLGRTATGVLYLFTFGLLGVGQLVDLVRLRQMVQDDNLRRDAFRALAEKRGLAAAPKVRQLRAVSESDASADGEETLRMKLLAAAAKRNGKLSVTEGVMATGKPFAMVEAELDAMAKSGYVGISNDDDTGMVVYTFGELSR